MQTSDVTAPVVTLVGRNHVPMGIEALFKFCLCQLQERSLYEATTQIENGCCEWKTTKHCVDLLECRLHTSGLGQICAKSDGLSTLTVDFTGDIFKVGRISCQQNDRICLSKPFCNRSSLQSSVCYTWGLKLRYAGIVRTVPGPTPAMIANALADIVCSFE